MKRGGISFLIGAEARRKDRGCSCVVGAQLRAANYKEGFLWCCEDIHKCSSKLKTFVEKAPHWLVEIQKQLLCAANTLLAISGRVCLLGLSWVLLNFWLRPACYISVSTWVIQTCSTLSSVRGIVFTEHGEQAYCFTHWASIFIPLSWYAFSCIFPCHLWHVNTHYAPMMHTGRVLLMLRR